MSPLVLLLFGAAPPIVPPDVTQWMRDLGHPNLAVRRTAVASLRERGEGVMPLLRKLAASDADVDVRVRASAINGMIRAELFEKPRVFDGNGGGDSDLAVSPDGRLALSAGDAVLKLWDVERGTLRASLKGHHCGIVGIAFAPDGKAAASGDIDGVIRLWDLGKGAEIRRWGGPGAIWCLTFAADGKAVYAGSDAGLVEAYTLDGKRT